MKKEAVVIGGTYINAYSIFYGLKKIDWDGDIFFLKDRRRDFTLIDLFRVPKLALEDFRHPIDLFSHLSKEYKKVFFLPTYEKLHEIMPQIVNKHPNIVFKGISRNNSAAVIDKFELYKFIETIGLSPWIPKYISGDMHPIKEFGERFIFRMKRSWKNGRKLPRVRIITSREEFQKYKNRLISMGYSSKDWCYQELLDEDPRSNLSIVGWHDKDFHRYMVTRRALGHPDLTGNGDVVEVLEEENYQSLLKVTETLLDGLEYEGPFELEFMYDRVSQTYKIIEINPRFWMQHLLFEVNNHFLMLKRYLDFSVTQNDGIVKKSVWINSVYYFFRLTKLEINVLKYINSESLFVPLWNTAFVWTAFYPLSKLQLLYCKK